MSDPFVLQRFESWDALAVAAANRLARALGEAVEARGEALLALSGGSTPGDIYRRLSRRALPWDRVTVTPTDERWVDQDSVDSNARLLRETVLRDDAGSARLLSLRPEEAGDPEDAAAQVSRSLAERRLDGAMLGMGADGHFASLFPNSPALARGLDPSAPACIAVPAGQPAPPQDRLSLTLATLLSAEALFVVIRGEEKLEVLRRAAWAQDAGGLPIAVLLRRAPAPLSVMWAP